MKKKIYCYISFVFLLFIACQSESNQSKNETAPVPATPEITQLNSLIAAQPDQGDLWFQRGALYYDLDKYDEAIRDLKNAIELNPSDIQAWHLLADAQLDNLQSREALETMETAAEKFSGRIATLLKLSEFQLILKRYGEAFNTIQRIQELDPQNADAFFMKGMVFKESGDTSQAISQFQASTKENPNMIDAWINLGQLLAARHDPDAIRYYDGGLAVAPDNDLLLHAKAQFLAGENKIEEAKQVYQRMMEITPYASEPYYDLGLLYLDQDSIEQAVNHFDLSIKIDPMFSRAYFYRGLTKEMMGNPSAAQSDYEQTLQIDPEDKDAAQALKRLSGQL
ncbi:MAG: tetratricopeptide repeat protein [Saprospiraceae bacterium]|nr:tetratricopeptide repeat protein [Saprospiraceae bacterium]